MKKPVFTWVDTFVRTGQKVVKNLKSSLSSEQNDLIPNDPLEVEALEERQLLSGSAQLDEGSTGGFNAEFAVTDSSVQYRILVDQGDGSSSFYFDEVSVNSGEAGHSVIATDIPLSYADDGQYQVKYSLESGGQILEEKTLQANVLDVKTFIEASSSTSSASTETPFEIQFSASDPGDDPIQKWVVNWGDGTIDEYDGFLTSAQHVYSDAGKFSVIVQAFDEDGVEIDWGGPSSGIHSFGVGLDSSFGEDGIAEISPDSETSTGDLRNLQYNFDGSDQLSISGKHELYSDEFFRVDPSKEYKLSFQYQTETTDGSAVDSSVKATLGFAAYDIDKNRILPYSYKRLAGSTDTRLAVDLKPGDTQIVLEDATGWYDSASEYKRNFAWFGYTDSTGHTYDDYTYTQNYLRNLWDEGAISGNVITLREAWSGPIIAKGTATRNASDGSWYNYIFHHLNSEDPWTGLEGIIGGDQDPGSTHGFRAGTAYVKAIVFSGRSGDATNHQLNVKNIRISEVESGAEQNVVSTVVNSDGSVTQVSTSSEKDSDGVTYQEFTFNGASGFSKFGRHIIETDQFFEVDPNSSYKLSAAVSSGDESGNHIKENVRQYLGYAAYDKDKNYISNYSFQFIAGSAFTTLAQDLNPGDTQIVLDDASGWFDGERASYRAIAWLDSPDQRYSKDYDTNLWDENGISGNIITLRNPWSGPSYSAGQHLRNARSSGGYDYAVLSYREIDHNQKELYSSIIGGNRREHSYTGFRPGTVYIRPIVLTNYYNGDGTNQFNVSDVSIEKVSEEVELTDDQHQFRFDGKEQSSYIGNHTIFSDKFIKIDPTKQYSLSATVNSGDEDGNLYQSNAKHYIGFAAYDSNKNIISPQYYRKQTGAVDTTLAVDLKPGDTVIHLNDVTGWYNGSSKYRRTFLWYGKDKSAPKTYVSEASGGSGYSRNHKNFAWDEGGVDYVNNTITLADPWTGPFIRAGEEVRNSVHGGTYNYALASNSTISQSQHHLSKIIGAGHSVDSNLGFRPEVAYIKAMVLVNYRDGAENQLNISDFTIREVNAPNLVYHDSKTLSGSSYVHQFVNRDLDGEFDRHSLKFPNFNQLTGSLTSIFDIIEVTNEESLEKQFLVGVEIEKGSSTTQKKMGLFLINADGSLDSNFGSGTGFSILSLDGDQFDRGMKLNYGGGKIHLLGRNYRTDAGSQQWDGFVQQFNSNGSIDTTFGTNGRVSIDFEGNSDEITDFVVQADGKVIVSARYFYSDSEWNSGWDAGLVRFNLDGSLDSSFGGDGKIQFRFNGLTGFNRVQKILIDGDGKIVVAGTRQLFGTLSSVAVARFLQDGTLDSSFGSQGLAGVAINGRESVEDALLQSDGKIVLGGTTRYTDGTQDAVQVAVIRFDANGEKDASFGTGGINLVDFDGNQETVLSLSEADTGGIFVAGEQVDSNGQSSIAIAKFLPSNQVEVTDPTVSRTLSFTSSPNGYGSLGTSINREVSWTYDGGNLEDVQVSIIEGADNGFSITPDPANAKATLNWTVPDEEGEHLVILEIVDQNNPAVRDRVSMIMSAQVSRPDTLQVEPIDPITAIVGEVVRFQINASSDFEEEQPFFYDGINLPEGAFIDNVTGEFVWQLEEQDVGNHSLNAIVVTNTSLAPHLRYLNFSITVVPENQVPELSGIPNDQLTVLEGNELNLGTGNLNISIVDDDEQSSDLLLTVSANGGSVKLGDESGVNWETGQPSQYGNQLQVRGTLAQLNATLASLSFIGDGSEGSNSFVRVEVNDLGNTVDSNFKITTESIFINVTPLAKPPQIRANQELSVPRQFISGLIGRVELDAFQIDKDLRFEILAGVQSDSFKIDQLTGEVYLVQGHDFTFDTEQELTLQIKATYTNGQNDVEDVKVLIEPQDNFGPNASNDQFSLNQGSVISGNLFTGIYSIDGGPEQTNSSGIDTSGLSGEFSIVSLTNSSLAFSVGQPYELNLGGTLVVQENGDFTLDTSTFRNTNLLYGNSYPGFYYTIQDKWGRKSEALASFALNHINNQHHSFDQTFSLLSSAESGDVVGSIFVEDDDTGYESFSYYLTKTADSSQDPSNLFHTFSINSNGELVLSNPSDLDGVSNSQFFAHITGASGSTPVTVELNVRVVDSLESVPDSLELVTTEDSSLSGSIFDFLQAGVNGPSIGFQTINVAGGTIVSGESHHKLALGGKLVVNSDGSFFYDPSTSETIQGISEGSFGSELVTLILTDTQGTQHEVDLTFRVLGRNDLVVATPNYYQTGISGKISGNLITDFGIYGIDSDIDGDSIQVVGSNSVDLIEGSLTLFSTLGATVTLFSDGAFIYDPSTLNANDLDSTSQLFDRFEYTISDGNDHLSSTASVGITVNVGVSEPTPSISSSLTNSSQSLFLYFIEQGTAADSRFQEAPLAVGSSEKFALARYNRISEHLQYQSADGTWVNFIAESSDRILGTVDLERNEYHSLAGTVGSIYGVSSGYHDGDLTVQFTPGENEVNSTISLTGTSFNVQSGRDIVSFALASPLQNQIFTDQSYIGSGFLVISDESIHTRFAGPNSPSTLNNANVFTARFDSMSQSWQRLAGDNTWISFTTSASDRIIAAVDFNLDRITLLNNQQSEIFGLSSGYISSNLDINFDPDDSTIINVNLADGQTGSPSIDWFGSVQSQSFSLGTLGLDFAFNQGDGSGWISNVVSHTYYPLIAGSATVNPTVPADHYAVDIGFGKDPEGKVIVAHTVQLDANGEANLDFSIDLRDLVGFESSLGSKTIYYRVSAKGQDGSTVEQQFYDNQTERYFGVYESTGWNVHLFDLLEEPDQGSIRFVDVGLYNDTNSIDFESGDVTENSITSDPRITGKLHGDFAGQGLDVNFSFEFEGTTYNHTISLTEPSEFLFDPTELGSGAFDSANNIAINYSVSLAGGPGGIPTPGLPSGTFTLNYEPLPNASGYVSIDTVSQDVSYGYGNASWNVEGRVNYSQYSSQSHPLQVVLEFDYSDENGDFDGIVDEETTGIQDSDPQNTTSRQFKFQHLLSGTANENASFKFRLKEWNIDHGDYLYGDWSTIQSLPALTGPNVGSLDVKENEDQYATRSLPKIVGYLEGAPSDPFAEEFDANGISNIRSVKVAYYFTDQTLDSASVADGYVYTNDLGHFEFDATGLQYGVNTIQTRTAIQLSDGSILYGTSYSHQVNLLEPIIPELLQDDFNLIDEKDAEVVDGIWLKTFEPTISGQLSLPQNDAIPFQNVSIELTVVNSDPENDPDEVIDIVEVDDTGFFSYTLAGYQGQVTLRARVVYSDPATGNDFRTSANWIEKKLQIESTIGLPTTVTTLELKEGTDDSVPHTSNPIIVGQIEDPNGLISGVEVEIQNVITSEILGTVYTRNDGSFEFEANGLPEGAYQVQARALNWDYQTGEQITWDWGGAFDFVVDAVVGWDVATFVLQSDTGSSQTDNITANPMLVGTLVGPDSLEIQTVRIEDGNGGFWDVQSNTTGEFVFNPTHFSPGTYNLTAKVVLVDEDSQNVSFSNGQSHAFTLTEKQDDPPKILDFEVQNLDETGATSAPVIKGRVIAEGPMDQVSVRLTTLSGTEFTINPNHLGYFTYRLDLSDEQTPETIIFGDAWAVGKDGVTEIHSTSSVETEMFTYLPSETPTASTLQTIAYTSPSGLGVISGSISDISQASESKVEVLNTDGQLIAILDLDESTGEFSYNPSNVNGGSYDQTLLFRVRRSVPGGIVYSSEYSFTFTHVETFNYTGIKQVILQSDTNQNGGSQSDGITSELVFDISMPSSDEISPETYNVDSETMVVQVDVDGDGIADFETSPNSETQFTFSSFQPDSPGFYSLKFRVHSNGLSTDRPWFHFNFIYDEDDASEPALALAKALNTIDPNWQYSALDFDGGSVAEIAQAIYDAASEQEDAANDFEATSAQQQKNAEEIAAQEEFRIKQSESRLAYESAMAQARAEFIAALNDLPEWQRESYTLEDFVWPESPRNGEFLPPDIADLPEAIRSSVYFDPNYSIDNDSYIIAKRQELEANYRESTKEARDAYQNDLEAIKSDYDQQIADADSVRKAAIEAARSTQETKTEADTQRDDEFKTELDYLIRQGSIYHYRYTTQKAKNHSAYHSTESQAKIELQQKLEEAKIAEAKEKQQAYEDAYDDDCEHPDSGSKIEGTGKHCEMCGGGSSEPSSGLPTVGVPSGSGGDPTDDYNWWEYEKGDKTDHTQFNSPPEHIEYAKKIYEIDKKYAKIYEGILNSYSKKVTEALEHRDSANAEALLKYQKEIIARDQSIAKLRRKKVHDDFLAKKQKGKIYSDAVAQAELDYAIAVENALYARKTGEALAKATMQSTIDASRRQIELTMANIRLNLANEYLERIHLNKLSGRYTRFVQLLIGTETANKKFVTQSMALEAVRDAALVDANLAAEITLAMHTRDKEVALLNLNHTRDTTKRSIDSDKRKETEEKELNRDNALVDAWSLRRKEFVEAGKVRTIKVVDATQERNHGRNKANNAYFTATPYLHSYYYHYGYHYGSYYGSDLTEYAGWAYDKTVADWYGEVNDEHGLKIDNAENRKQLHKTWRETIIEVDYQFEVKQIKAETEESLSKIDSVEKYRKSVNEAYHEASIISDEDLESESYHLNQVAEAEKVFHTGQVAAEVNFAIEKSKNESKLTYDLLIAEINFERDIVNHREVHRWERQIASRDYELGRATDFRDAVANWTAPVSKLSAKNHHLRLAQNYLNYITTVENVSVGRIQSDIGYWVNHATFIADIEIAHLEKIYGNQVDSDGAVVTRDKAIANVEISIAENFTDINYLFELGKAKQKHSNSIHDANLELFNGTAIHDAARDRSVVKADQTYRLQIAGYQRDDLVDLIDGTDDSSTADQRKEAADKKKITNAEAEYKRVVGIATEHNKWSKSLSQANLDHTNKRILVLSDRALLVHQAEIQRAAAVADAQHQFVVNESNADYEQAFDMADRNRRKERDVALRSRGDNMDVRSVAATLQAEDQKSGYLYNVEEHQRNLTLAGNRNTALGTDLTGFKLLEAQIYYDAAVSAVNILTGFTDTYLTRETSFVTQTENLEYDQALENSDIRRSAEQEYQLNQKILRQEVALADSKLYKAKASLDPTLQMKAVAIQTATDLAKAKANKKKEDFIADAGLEFVKKTADAYKRRVLDQITVDQYSKEHEDAHKEFQDKVEEAGKTYESAKQKALNKQRQSIFQARVEYIDSSANSELTHHEEVSAARKKEAEARLDAQQSEEEYRVRAKFEFASKHNIAERDFDLAIVELEISLERSLTQNDISIVQSISTAQGQYQINRVATEIQQISGNDSSKRLESLELKKTWLENTFSDFVTYSTAQSSAANLFQLETDLADLNRVKNTIIDAYILDQESRRRDFDTEKKQSNAYFESRKELVGLETNLALAKARATKLYQKSVGNAHLYRDDFVAFRSAGSEKISSEEYQKNVRQADLALARKVAFAELNFRSGEANAEYQFSKGNNQRLLKENSVYYKLTAAANLLESASTTRSQKRNLQANAAKTRSLAYARFQMQQTYVVSNQQFISAQKNNAASLQNDIKDRFVVSEQTIEGIVSGFKSSDIQYQYDQFGGNQVDGQVKLVGSEFVVSLNNSDQTVLLGDLKSGLALPADTTGSVYVMFSSESVHSRFSSSAPDAENADHLIAVRFHQSQWEYSDGQSWVVFTTESSDRLISQLDLDAKETHQLGGASVWAQFAAEQQNTELKIWNRLKQVLTQSQNDANQLQLNQELFEINQKLNFDLKALSLNSKHEQQSIKEIAELDWNTLYLKVSADPTKPSSVLFESAVADAVYNTKAKRAFTKYWYDLKIANAIFDQDTGIESSARDELGSALNNLNQQYQDKLTALQESYKYGVAYLIKHSQTVQSKARRILTERLVKQEREYNSLKYSGGAGSLYYLRQQLAAIENYVANHLKGITQEEYEALKQDVASPWANQLSLQSDARIEHLDGNLRTARNGLFKRLEELKKLNQVRVSNLSLNQSIRDANQLYATKLRNIQNQVDSILNGNDFFVVGDFVESQLPEFSTAPGLNLKGWARNGMTSTVPHSWYTGLYGTVGWGNFWGGGTWGTYVHNNFSWESAHSSIGGSWFQNAFVNTFGSSIESRLHLPYWSYMHTAARYGAWRAVFASTPKFVSGKLDFETGLKLLQNVVNEVGKTVEGVLNSVAQVGNHVGELISDGIDSYVEFENQLAIEKYEKFMEELAEKIGENGMVTLRWEVVRALEKAGLVVDRLDTVFAGDYIVIRLGDKKYFYREPDTAAFEYWLVKSIDALDDPAEDARQTRLVYDLLIGQSDEFYWNALGIVLSVIPGGSTATNIADGNEEYEKGNYGKALSHYGWAVLNFASDVALTISGIGLVGKVSSGVGRLTKLGKVTRVGQKLQNFAKRLNDSPKLLAAVTISDGLIATIQGGGAVAAAIQGNPNEAAIKGLDAFFSALGFTITGKQFLDMRRRATDAGKEAAEQIAKAAGQVNRTAKRAQRAANTSLDAGRKPGCFIPGTLVAIFGNQDNRRMQMSIAGYDESELLLLAGGSLVVAAVISSSLQKKLPHKKRELDHERLLDQFLPQRIITP